MSHSIVRLIASSVIPTGTACRRIIGMSREAHLACAAYHAACRAMATLVADVIDAGEVAESDVIEYAIRAWYTRGIRTGIGMDRNTAQSINQARASVERAYVAACKALDACGL